jgi:predicted MFS family arabinose efflux permease
MPGVARSAAFIALFFCLGVFINSFIKLPLSFLLKDGLRLSARQLSWFGAISDWAWYIKPVLGMITDRAPIFGKRRTPYLALMGALLTGAWLWLAVSPAYSYRSLLGAMALSALALAFMNTVTAGLLAELSRVNSSSGRLNSLRQLATQAAIVAAGPAGGWAAHYWPFQRVAGVASGTAAVLLIGALALVREPRAAPTGIADRGEKNSGALIAALRSPGVWLAFLFILLVELSPGFNTPLFFYERDVLHFDQRSFGWIDMTGALAAILAALGYARWCRRRSLAAMLPAIIAGHALVTLTWLGLRDPNSALAIKALTGFTWALTNLAIFDLATRAAPAGAEGTVLAAIFAGVNIAGRASDLIGSSLYDQHWSLRALVFLNAGTTLLSVCFVPLIPRSLVRHRDGEPEGARQT